MTLDETVCNLKKVILDENCQRMNQSTVKGFLREILVKQALENSKFDVIHYGNQTGYDLSIRNNQFRIDVKMSRLKDEFRYGQDHWGWALYHENKKRKISATHYVCLGCDNDLYPKIFIVIPSGLTNLFPHGIGQFSKVTHALCFFPEGKWPTKQLPINVSNYIELCRKQLQRDDIKILKTGDSFIGVFS
jgi:hypothetical protein